MVGGVGRVVAAVVQRSACTVRTREVQPEWSEESDERGGLILKDSDGEAFALLTQDQVGQISEFLEHPECLALIQFMLIARFAKQGDQYSGLAEEYEESFKFLAETHCNEKGYNWASLGVEIWKLVMEYTESTFPFNELSSLVTTEERERISAYVGGNSKLSGRARPANLAFREVVDILGDSNRFLRSREAQSDIRIASEHYYSELNLTHAISHTADNFRFDHGDLYVDRHLREFNTARVVDDSFLIDPSARPRCVVVGNPGVGKSTMTQHLVHKLSSTLNGEMGDFAALSVQCKDVANQDGNSYFLEAVSRSLRETLQLNVSEECLNDLATLGRAFFIFDGIDEIIDLTRRRAFVKNIEAFARRYPLIPVLVTARRVGYGKAALNTREFKVLELDDFSEDQVGEYATKWFAATSRESTEREAFIRETEEIPDIRINPLMLSLLCALYRVRGYIPRNRREVYKSCADLLFQRWDAMRQIEQPMDHRQYGTRLMQELAFFFYKSQSAQAGVQEVQLRKIIAIFFTDTAAIDRDEADRRAHDFLDFCADRAWLLSYQGTSDLGERLFGFTHRTFMEYFAAEAVVRRARSLDEIVEEIAKAHERDASSVLADVIFQCADEKYDAGARDIVSGLLTRGGSGLHASKYIALCLRMMNAAPIPPRATDAVFNALFNHWADVDPEDSLITATALFELYRDPRARLLQLLQTDDEKAELVLTRWSRFFWRGESPLFDSVWTNYLYDLAGGIGVFRSTDKPLLAYLIHHGILTVDSVADDRWVSWLVTFPSFGTLTPGPAISDMEHCVWGLADDSRAGTVLQGMSTSGITARLIITPDDLSEIFASVIHGYPDISKTQLREKEFYENCSEFLLWACCALFEERFPSLHSFHELIDGVHGLEWFSRIAATRSEGPDSQVESFGNRPFTHADLQSMVSSGMVPRWFREWCSGEISFLPPNGS